MDKLRVFSEKLGAAISINEGLAVCGADGSNLVLSASWTNGGWNNYSDDWLNGGWNNYSHSSWQNGGWNNYSHDSWSNSGWNNYSYSWSNGGWNNSGGK